jgi:hypothetical protein
MTIYDAREVSAILGVTTRRLKSAISAGVLPPPDRRAAPFALAQFSQDWIERARTVSADTIRATRYQQDVFTHVLLPGGVQSVIMRDDVWESALAAAARARIR